IKIIKNSHMKGTIKTLTDRGFGFIARDGEEKDLFFHSKELKGVTFDELKVGDALTFEIANGEKGPSAVNVSRA
ncbi:MAG: cold shock domain-containing protein, partial [Patescibacteria group bacterium]